MFLLAAILILIFVFDIAWYWAILVCLLACIRFTYSETVNGRTRRKIWI